jgi:hypothetical protein
MRARQVTGYLILAVALGFGVYKISASGLLDRLGDSWFSFLGVFALIILLILAMARILRA